MFVRNAVQQIISAMGALAVSERWQSIRAVLDRQVQPPPQELVCYCLGDVAEEQVAYQLALFLLLANHWGIRNTERLVYDPAHATKDREVIHQCGCTVLPHDEKAERTCSVRTCFYMPFAPYTLTDNVVRGNWNGLHRISIIGNPLGFVMGKTLEEKHFKGRAPCVQAAHHLVTEHTLWEGDFETWLTKAPTVQSEEGSEPSEEGDIRMSALNATLSTFRQPLTPERDHAGGVCTTFLSSEPPARIGSKHRSKL